MRYNSKYTKFYEKWWDYMRSTEIYEKNIENTRKDINEVNKGIDRVALLRGVSFIVLIILGYQYFKKGSPIILGLSLVLIGVFIYLAITHTREKEKLRELELLIGINDEHLRRAEGLWKDFSDKGEDFLKEDHPFTNDLDIFGESSLFQWINTTKTFYGRVALAKILSDSKLPTKSEVDKRQKSIRELADKLDFRQRLELIPLKHKSSIEKTENFLSWVKEENSWFLSSNVNILRIIMPCISLITVLLIAFFKAPFSLFFLSLIINAGILSLKKKEIEKALEEIYSFKKNLAAYYEGIELIENQTFNEELNKSIKEKINSKDGVKASKEMKELSNIGELLFDRANMIYWLLNALLMWDFMLMARLEKWKARNRDKVENWLLALGDMEAYSSLSNVCYDKEHWVFPEILDEDIIEGKEIAHPLIIPQGVENSFNLNGELKTALITGSNMSGKSTFLRTIGINMIFSYLGLPINGKSFKLGRMIPYTCMRTKDNLEERISSFYAEILRVKNIIEATKRGEKIFFLLDEIFKGTNSADRHLGAEILIKQLMDKGAKGLVSTHDFELCDLEKEDRRIKNLHFREYYENNEIKFDYKLREGRSTTRNAVYLMKMAGIELLDKE